MCLTLSNMIQNSYFQHFNIIRFLSCSGEMERQKAPWPEGQGAKHSNVKWVNDVSFCERSKPKITFACGNQHCCTGNGVEKIAVQRHFSSTFLKHTIPEKINPSQLRHFEDIEKISLRRFYYCNCTWWTISQGRRCEGNIN